jgi:hypothetical protein
MPDIQLVAGSEQHRLEGSEIMARAVAVPKDMERFEGQVVVFLDELLADFGHPGTIRCVSPRGETYAFAAAEATKFSLLSTNTPSWKLIPAGRDQLHEITVPRFVLREVARIELGSTEAVEDASDQVFTNLTDALMKPRAVRFLNLTSAGLERFPSGVFELVRLESLNLGKNQIETIPPAIGDLSNLKVLKLSRNRLRSLPEEIGRLKLLTELHVSRNQIECLPEKFWNLERLELLNLGENRLSGVSESIRQLTHLRQLELSVDSSNRD